MNTIINNFYITFGGGKPSSNPNLWESTKVHARTINIIKCTYNCLKALSLKCFTNFAISLYLNSHKLFHSHNLLLNGTLVLIVSFKNFFTIILSGFMLLTTQKSSNFRTRGTFE